MTQGIKRFVIVAAIAAVLVITGGTAAWAQCPSSPSYSPDFSNLTTQNCLTLNGTAAFGSTAYNQPQPPETPNPAQPAPSNVSTVLRVTPNTNYATGSAWFNTQQSVAGAFTTTFTFQLSGSTVTPYGPADGFAFVIQNSPAVNSQGQPTALGPDGCGMGFADGSCATSSGGIPNSLAVDFKTYNDGYPNPNNNSVSIVSNQTGPNCIDKACNIAYNNSLPNGINLADGFVHTVTITYAPPNSTCGPAGTSPCPTIDVILDNNDLFPATGANPNPVFFNLSTIGLASGSSCSMCLAWVGFTAASGGGDDYQDILSWTFTPQAQSAVISQNAPTSLNFPNAAGANEYAYTAQLTAPYPTPEVQVQPILMTQAACDALVQTNFWPARCFVYDSAENTGENMSVLFSVTCPTSPGGVCGNGTNFDATLGTTFNYMQSENPFFTYPGILGLLNPFPGWLKGGTGTTPCTPIPNTPLFQSNQISSFIIDKGVTKGGSGGGASCWVATYDTPGEIWPGITISSPKFTTYKLNQTVTASYTCTNPATSQPLPPTSSTGPYLTVDPSLMGTKCKQSTGTQSCTYTPVTGPGQAGGLACTGSVDTSTKGLHVFEVTAIDSGQNQNVDVVIYDVK